MTLVDFIDCLGKPPGPRLGFRVREGPGYPMPKVPGGLLPGSKRDTGLLPYSSSRRDVSSTVCGEGFPLGTGSGGDPDDPSPLCRGDR